MAQADPESRPLASGAPQPLVERRCGPAWGLEPEKYCGQGGDPGTKRAPPLLAAFHPGGAASCRRGWPLLTELHCSAGGGVPGANRGCRGLSAVGGAPETCEFPRRGRAGRIGRLGWACRLGANLPESGDRLLFAPRTHLGPWTWRTISL